MSVGNPPVVPGFRRSPLIASGLAVSQSSQALNQQPNTSNARPRVSPEPETDFVNDGFMKN